VVDKDASTTLGGLGRLTDPVLLITNVLLVQNYSPTTAFTGLGVSWSLVTEIGFYIMLPALGYLGVVVARRRSRVLAALVPGLLLLVVGVACRIGSLAWNNGHNVTPESTWNSVFDRSTLVQCDLFGVGMIAAALLVSSQSMSPKAMARLRRWGWTVIVFCAMAVVLLGRGEKLTTFMGIAFATGIVLTQISGADAACRWFVRVMDTAPPRIAGEISLSTYLWHYPVLLFLLKHWGEDLRYESNGQVLVAWVCVAVPSLILGAITYRLVELPAMSRKRRTDRTQPDAKPA
jgi:peptidoglycan/LPS O-acetylase OafA/YrhL